MHPHLHAASWLATLVTGVALSGCASIESKPLLTNPTKQQWESATSNGGVVYYLPTQRLRITLTVAKPEKPGGPSRRSIEITSLPAVADIDYPYEARHVRSQSGTSKFKVGVTASGLLNSVASGETKPAMDSLVKAFASATTGGTILRNITGLHVNPCANPGIYLFTLVPVRGRNETLAEIESSGNTEEFERLRSCRVIVDIRPLQGTRAYDPKSIGHEGDADIYGFYYRQALPIEVRAYEVDEKDKRVVEYLYYDSVVSSSSPIHFVRIPRVVFSDTAWSVTFINGSPTVVDLSTGGEVVGFLSLPAQLIKAYSDAILSGFQRKTNEAKDEAAYLAQLNSLATAQAVNEACRVAVATKDPEIIKAACAGK